MLINAPSYIHIQPLAGFSSKPVQTDILRLDRVHPVVSGNKWFKLKYYLDAAINQSKGTIASFGGAYSNHILAVAFAGKEKGLKTVGFIRGDTGTKPSHTLEQASLLGMELVFVDRTAFRNKKQVVQQWDRPGWLWIPEGGYGEPGARGAAEILAQQHTGVYSHIICACGTGTMMAGLVKAALPGQEVIGFSVLKGHHALLQDMEALLTPAERQKKYTLITDYHFGGYARHPETLIGFMRELWQQEQLPTDFVYTAKLLYGVKDRLQNHYFPAGSRLLLIHSGGLQGNDSLPSGTLPF